MHRDNMSSDALMEKPNTVKCRCRKHSWYIVLVSFLLWFGLFYLYSSLSVGDNGLGLVDSNEIEVNVSSSDLESNIVHDVDKKEAVVEVSDVNGGEDSENETENARKPVSKSLVRRVENVDQIMDLVNELEANNQTLGRENDTGIVDAESSAENDEGKPSKEDDDTRKKDEGIEIVDPSSLGEKESTPVVEKGNENNVLKQKPENVARRSSIRSKRESMRQKIKQNVDSSPVVQKRAENTARVQSGPTSCAGRYIYIHNLPKKFNQDLLDNCRSLSEWTDMCEYTANYGLGSQLPDYDKVYSRTGWFGTNQFLLEVIFHNRMKQYRCLTKDPSLASAIFVPYYAGLDVGRYLWDSDGFMRDYDALNLVKWLAAKPEWKRMWGGDHFLVAGRINWDFRRDPKNESDWGNELLNLPESRNMTTLVLESSPWNYNDFAIPYPTYFHPSSDIEVFQWQNRMRRLKRRYLFSFAGAPRPNLHESIRNEVIDQCRASRRKCRLLECHDKNNKCYKPVYVMKMFQNSVYCLQPPGDSYTRRSVFDSILAGCIPVFFHPGTAYVQYIWHLPKDYTKYSVFIPGTDVKSGKANIERILQRIPKEKRLAMREEVIKLIPKVIYANPTSRLETLEDAFDLTINGVLDRVETIRQQIRDGKSLNSDFIEDDSWKYFTYGTVGPHEWDPIFANRNLKA
ncbi:hypothetical protein SLE2022_283340 [Rubroshorea leprosula]